MSQKDASEVNLQVRRSRARRYLFGPSDKTLTALMAQVDLLAQAAEMKVKYNFDFEQQFL